MKSNGITTSALNLLRSLDPERYDVSVILNRTREQAKLANQALIPPEVRQFPRIGGMNGSKLSHVGRKLRQRRPDPSSGRLPVQDQELWHDEWVRCFGDARFDAAIDFSGYSPFWASLILQSQAPLTAIWLHNDMVAELDRHVSGGRTLRKGLEGVFVRYRHFDRLVSVSQQLNVVNSAGLKEFAPADRFCFVHNMVDVPRILEASRADVRSLDEYPRDEVTGLPEVPEWAQRLSSGDGTRWFINVARLSEEKNQQRLLHAFARVHAENPRTGLLIVGHGPLRGHLQREIERMGLQGAAYLTGAYSNPLAIMSAADCFVLSSNYEGQPMVLLEAATLGLPIVTVAFGSVRDSDHGAGMIVTEQSEDALAEGMREALQGRVVRGAFDAQSYMDSVLEEFDTAIGVPARKGSAA